MSYNTYNGPIITNLPDLRLIELADARPKEQEKINDLVWALRGLTDFVATGGDNIYNIDGTLTANRTLTGADKDLTFSGLHKLTLIATHSGETTTLTLDDSGFTVASGASVASINMSSFGGLTLNATNSSISMGSSISITASGAATNDVIVNADNTIELNAGTNLTIRALTGALLMEAEDTFTLYSSDSITLNSSNIIFTGGTIDFDSGINVTFNSVAPIDDGQIVGNVSGSFAWVTPTESRPQFTTSGGNPAYTGTPSPAIASYVSGHRFQVKINATSNGNSTLNLNGIGAKNVYLNPTTQATTGDLVANQIYHMVYDSTLNSGSGGFLVIAGLVMNLYTKDGLITGDRIINANGNDVTWNSIAAWSMAASGTYTITSSSGEFQVSVDQGISLETDNGNVNISGLNISIDGDDILLITDQAAGHDITLTSDAVFINSVGGLSIDATGSNGGLKVSSTEYGILFPRMTSTQRDNIDTIVNGIVLYNTTTDKLQVRAAGAWVDLH